MGAPFHQIRAFANVVREGSFSAAARALGVSQSALTQHVSKLENTLGSSLVLRTQQGVVLTATGRDFWGHCEDFLRLDRAIADKIHSYAHLERGNLRIIANAPQPALRVIEEFSGFYPDVEVEFALFDWTSAMQLLKNSEVDIGFVTAPSSDDRLYSRRIEEARFVLYCRSDHRLSRRTSISLLDLEHDVLLLPEKGSLTERVVYAAFRKLGKPRRRVVKTTTFPVMKEAIIQGVGIGIFLENSAMEERRLVEIPIHELAESFATHVVVPKAKLEHQLVKRFAEI